jgi:hypothetical protein
MVNVLIAMVITLTIFENAMFVLQRNPLAVAFGAQTRERYIERVAPSYFELMQNMDDLPPDAHVYYLFEPRSYNMPRITQADALITNFAHDQFLYQTPDKIIQSWKAKGCTHVLVYETGKQFILDNNPAYKDPSMRNALSETINNLQIVSQTSDGVYSIYKIP